MHITDVGMQYYTHIARFTTVTLRTINRNAMKIEFSVLLFTFTYSLSQKIVKSHVSNYLNIKKINTQFTCN
jgi:hypothetical protein